jgi:uncharacterized protein YhdP
MPVGVMSTGLVKWLDNAVTDGYVSFGTLILHGDIERFPFNEHDGVFQALFSPQDVNISFLKDWPLLSDVSGSLKFNNQSLFISNAQGRTLQTSLFNGFAEIIDLSDAVLSVTTDAHGTNENMQAYVWQSPLDDVFGNTLRLFQFEGESDLSLKLELPLKTRGADIAIDGHLNLINASLYYPLLGYEINDINGVLDFTNHSLFADSVKATIQNRPVSLNVYTREDGSDEVVFHFDGAMSADYLLQRYQWIPDEWIAGQSDWSIDMTVPRQVEDHLLHISASSLLEDVVVQVSDKVNKQDNNKVVFLAEIDVLPDNGMLVDAKASRYMSAKDQPVKDQPVKDQPALDQGEKVSPDKVFDLFAVRDENSLWNFDIKSEYMTGKGEFTEGLDHDTEVKLNLENIDVHSLFVTKDSKKSQPLKPTDFPPLNWKFKQALWDGWIFSDVVVETGWHEHGMLINKYTLKGPAMTFDARGTWLTKWRGTHETVLQGTITSSNMGKTLTGLGFQRSIDRAKYSATFNSKWPAAPYGVSWANMKGKTSFEMNDGEMLDVEPGAGGRILGLLNIFRLAGRLVFDFDDVYRDGYSFDTINGEFEFVNGDGSLKDVRVSAAAADISMFGSIGMVKRDYGLLMRVKPHTDTLTFAGGALLGGVVVGAGLALIQKVFDLGVIGHNVYSITGSWDDPVVEKIVEKTANVADTEEDGF